MTIDDYKNILISQNNRCGICGSVLIRTNIDHDHKSNKIRGILCPQCNRSLGLLYDDPDIIYRSIQWLTVKGDKL